MAAITTRPLPLRLNTHPLLRPLLRHASTPSDSECGISPSVSSNFDQVKASLQNQQPKSRPRPRITRELFSYSNSTPSGVPPSKTATLEEIRHNLSEFRVRSAGPPPSTSSARFVPFKELHKRNVMPTPYDSDEKTSAGSAAGGGLPFAVIRDSLSQLRATTPVTRNRNDPTRKTVDPMSLACLKDSLKLNASGSTTNPPLFSFVTKKEDDGNDTRIELVNFYGYSELGKKLEMLRTEKRKGKWFSLQELTERLVRLRKIEEEKLKGKEKGWNVQGISFKELKECMLNARLSADNKAMKKTMLRLDILGSLGGMQSFMLSPPKEQLVEKYFHPDNMSAVEKLKLELEKVREEFRTSDSDCGSARVQVAQLTTKIKHLSTVLHKKDKHSRKGLQAMVQRRKKLLKYLRRTDWDSYSMLLSKLGLRDNPYTKA